jgi:iron(III) transport system substrate-binding protein
VFILLTCASVNAKLYVVNGLVLDEGSNMRTTSRIANRVTQRRLGALLVLVAALIAAAATSATAAQRGPTATGPKPATKAAWAQLVARAKREGEVTLYTTQIPALVTSMAQGFEKKYGIKVNINRQVDNVLVAQINAGFSANKVQADLWVSNARGYVLGALKNGWVGDAVGPHFFDKRFDRAVFAKPGKAWIAGTAVIGYGWNKGLYSRGLAGFRDLTKPELKGRVGVLQPLSPAAVDFWLWIQERFGRGFITQLAAQQPKVYASTTTMQPALASGEISAGSFIGTNVKDLIAQGAPIGFALPEDAWNTPYYAMILKRAPHSAAAQLLADYMVSAEGQALLAKNSGSVLKGVADTYYVKPRITKLNELTPSKIAAFQSYWNSIFRS